MYKLFVIGVSNPILSTMQREIIANCSLIVGAKRFLGLANGFAAQFIEITPLKKAILHIHDTLQKNNVVVLASGDPLFYGIGRKLLLEFPKKKIQLYPALSSIQMACALFKIPWDDVQIISLHGRNATHLPGLLLGNKKNLLLTDQNNSPDRIATKLLEYLQLIGETDLPEEIRILVAEDIGLETQKLFQGNLRQASQRHFSSLCVLCLLTPKPENGTGHRFGLIEKNIHHSRGLITKNEVRAASIHQLQLPPRGIFWDIGAGSGSISIEAARLNPRLTIYAVDHKAEAMRNIKNNIAKFRCYNVVPVFGKAPEVLASIPAPDRIFIGGSSGALPGIIAQAEKHLQSDGCLVVNAVMQKTIQMAPKLMKRHNFTVNTSVIKVTRTNTDDNVLDFNPITIITARK